MSITLVKRYKFLVLLIDKIFNKSKRIDDVQKLTTTLTKIWYSITFKLNCFHGQLLIFLSVDWNIWNETFIQNYFRTVTLI